MRKPLNAKKMVTPKPAMAKPFGEPSDNVPKIYGSRLNSAKSRVRWKITTDMAANALKPFSPGKNIGLLLCINLGNGTGSFCRLMR